MRKSKEELKFRAKKYSKTGIVSLAAGIAAVIVFIAEVVYSTVLRGAAGIAAGIGAIIGFIISFIGFWLAYKSFKERDIYTFPSIIGLIINGVMFIVYMCLYIIGMV